MNWLPTAIGSTSLLTAMSGLPGEFPHSGVRIMTAGGPGFLSVDGPGFLMNPGAGALSIMEDGTGGMDSAGIGSPRLFGGLPGFTGGIGVTVTTVGHPSVTTVIRAS